MALKWGAHIGDGATGVSTNRVTANFMFLTEILFGTPVIVFPKMLGRTFFQSGKIHYFCSGPVGVDPMCP